MVLRETKLRGANLSKCILALTDLTNADMENANLSGAALLGTNFRGANLARAKLQNAIFRSMEIMDKVGKPTGRFQKTDLDMANLIGATVSDFDLSQCSVDGAKFETN